ncbi:hypothetical protein DPMN_066846 [Dreissena polymorpha]|uniref:Uncharacterized protein n=1 Tax=Dreissena polymorpha TaxID=45954 RepID=A0A9D3YYP2_DREPO|nr:hypothetical protein DPMN_066846 [Dreissena polymorpha]
MMLGREVYTHAELVYPFPPHEAQPVTEYVHNLEQSMVSVHETARRCLSGYQAHMKRDHDVRLCQNPYRVGDLNMSLMCRERKAKLRSCCHNGLDRAL